MKISENFLEINQFRKLQNLILDLDFPWRLKTSMTKNDENIFFAYSFFNNNTVNSPLYDEFILPILEKLKCKAPIEVRANMILNKFFNKSGWHTDREFENNTAILYLNNCDGGTEFKIDDETKFIKAEENKIIVFPSKIEHRALTSTDVDRRYIININYF